MDTRVDEVAANGAPAGEPEVWNENVAEFTPLRSHLPEPSPVLHSPSFGGEGFAIDEYLQEERGKDMLRFSTAGSVDDGKSTLIGRLLYDTQSVYDDQLRSIEGKGTTAPGVLDLALLTDGLRAEREQGITIDVAYRYFSTSRRKFIIADTPGHEQYTRNMATGASTADVAVVLVDARKGVLPQSRRHAAITALLGVRHVIVAVNKMDLVSYAEDVLRSVEAEFRSFFEALPVEGRELTELHFVPVSALAGDNVVHSSAAMPWYAGPTLLTLLETIPSSVVDTEAPFRMAVQRVVRPDLDFRGFAGQISAGSVRSGDRLVALPSRQTATVQRIVTFDGDLSLAHAPMSVTLTLDREIDISRGDVLVSVEEQSTVSSHFDASLVWMDETPLHVGHRYLLKIGSRTTMAVVVEPPRLMDLLAASEVRRDVDEVLSMNGIATVRVETLQPIAFDSYAMNRRTGSFVLIDLHSNATVAAGMIHAPVAVAAMAPATVTRTVRLRRHGTLRLEGSEDAVSTALRALRSEGELEGEA